MSLLTQSNNCNCPDNCKCDVPICITKGVNESIQFNCNYDSKDCPLNLQTIIGVTLTIICPCCNINIATITDYEIGRCDCYITITPLNTDTIPKGEYDYTIILLLDNDDLLLTQKGKLKVI